MTRLPEVNVMPGTANICYELDKRLMCWLRDGRTMIGVLKSVDQYGNIIVAETIERIYVDGQYGDIPRGIVLLKGDTLFMLGEVDEAEERNMPLERTSIEDVLIKQAKKLEERREERKALKKALRERGIPESVEDL